MYAVVQTGGKQYTVQEGSKLAVEKLNGKVGDSIDLSDVLFVGGEKVTIGTPWVSGVSVNCKITGQEKEPKVIIYKYKRRKRYHKKQGHRQWLTHLEVVKIDLSAKPKKQVEVAPKVPKTQVAAPETPVKKEVKVEAKTEAKPLKKKVIVKKAAPKSAVETKTKTSKTPSKKKTTTPKK